MDQLISITEPAAKHIKKMMGENKNAIGFRLSLKKTGCSGYSYVPSLIEKINSADLAFDVFDLKVFVDKECKEFIKNLEIDYVEDVNAGLKQKRLVFNNPNEKNRCGCGESFTID